MTVIYNRGNENVSASGILYANKNEIRKLVTYMIVNAVEGNLDMVLDCPEEYPDKNSIESVFDTLNDQCLDQLEDRIGQLLLEMQNQLKTLKTSVRVMRIDYKESGEVDDIHLQVDVV